MNSSCIGPILTLYLNSKNWINIFIDELDENGLVAPIIEFPPRNDKYVNNLKIMSQFSSISNLYTIPFAHSYFLTFNKKSIDCLLRNNALPKNDINTPARLIGTSF